MCRKAKVSRFFVRLCAVEEALKTAKSSAAAANKYAIFLLSGLSGCQPFAVLYSSLALHWVSVSARPAPGARASAAAGSMPDSSWRSNRMANKKVKQCDGRISMQFDVCVHLLLLLLCFPFSFFPHIPFDWISIWLQFFVSAERWHGEISDSWMVNSLGSVGFSCGSFCCQPIELSAKFFWVHEGQFVFAILMDRSTDKLMN